MPTFADKVIQFNQHLDFQGILPEGIGVLNPFRDNPEALVVSSAFYRKFYNDSQRRHLILGINPGRHGAGLTGIPFTDPKRLVEKCGIPFGGPAAHEPSSVFVYEMIEAFGGMESFYQRLYINSVCPLGFVKKTDSGSEVNYNYYDSKELTAAARDFILWNLRRQIEMGVHTDVCFCFGTGENYRFLQKINTEYGFFGQIVPLDHPRFVMQYKAKSKQLYIEKYLRAFDGVR